MENYLMINGKKIELTEEQIKILSDKEEKKEKKKERKKNIWNPHYEEKYYWIDFDGYISYYPWENVEADNAAKKAANCCTDENIMKKRALAETLNRLLWRFSLQNGWDDRFFKEDKMLKYNVYYDTLNKKFGVDFDSKCLYQNIYFVSKEVAQRAIDEIIKPFIEKHPEIMEG